MEVQEKSGVVLRSTGSHYSVLADGEIVECVVKGKFRIKGIRSTNPIAVGDRVIIKMEEDGSGVISELKERDNYIIRKSVKLSKHSHILAANIDQAIIVCTIEKPYTSTGFIDRFLITAEAYHIPALLIFNKVDLYEEQAIEKLADMIYAYEQIGYGCHTLNAMNSSGADLNFLKEILQDKTTLILGHSGVGKSTLINKVDSDLDLRTRSISEYHESGQHTTTFAQMFPLKFGGYIIDTPGIKGFGLVDFKKEELSHYFPEMREHLHDCKFHNCQHINEPGCAVKEALEKGEIPLFRYENYLTMYEDFDDENLFRTDIYK